MTPTKHVFFYYDAISSNVVTGEVTPHLVTDGRLETLATPVPRSPPGGHYMECAEVAKCMRIKFWACPRAYRLVQEAHLAKKDSSRPPPRFTSRPPCTSPPKRGPQENRGARKVTGVTCLLNEAIFRSAPT